MDLTKDNKPNLNLDIVKLIQPDLLSVEELRFILQERGVGLTLLSQNKDKLVSLFKRVALPLPQRHLRENYRGSLLMKLRRKAERLKTSASTDISSKSYTIGVAGNSTLVKHNQEETSTTARLKPPPDLVNYDRRKIRLNSGSSSIEISKLSSRADLDKIVIKKRKTSESSSESSIDNNCTNKARKSVLECQLKTNPHSDTLKNNIDTNEQCNTSSVNNDLPKKISLKRSHLMSKMSNSTTEDGTVPEPDKKRAPITWP